MDNKEKIEIALAIVHGSANTEVVRQKDPAQSAPTYYQKEKEREAGPSGGWSGAWARSR
jgi:hypothetical protein